MRSRPLLAVLLVVAAGCSARNPVAVVSPSSTTAPYTFVLSSPDDPRLPAPSADATETGGDGLVGSSGDARVPAIDPATTWNRLTTELGIAAKLPPPALARVYGLTHVAIYDALVAAKSPRRGHLPADALAAGAASVVLTDLFPAAADRIAQAAATQANLDRGHGNRRAARAWALGRAVGALAVEHGHHDGHDLAFVGPPPSGPGIWTGTNPVLPRCGDWTCWIIRAGDDLQPAPPYAYGSPQDLREADEVLEVSLHRTPEMVAVVHKWADQPPPTIWNGILIDRVASRHFDAFESARAFAFLNATMLDAFVSCWKSKYIYWTARPFQRTPGLVTVITTPNFPTYTSGHSTVSAAAAQVMGKLFPSERAYFRAQAEEAAVSRLWGGIHFRHDNDQGLAVGSRIGERAVALMRRSDAALAMGP